MSTLGVSVDPEKVEVVMSWERPKSVFEIRSFLGLAGYYKRFVENFSRLATPMTGLTRKEVCRPQKAVFFILLYYFIIKKTKKF